MSKLGTRVLVVTGDLEVAESTTIFLDSMGLNAVFALDIPSAITIAERFRPEVVIVDTGPSHVAQPRRARQLLTLAGIASIT